MIRPAVPSDAPQIARLIIQALEDLAVKYVDNPDPYQAVPLFEHFIGLPVNQYSYENILVCEEHEEICGFINGYDGADFEKLRAPFLKFIQLEYGVQLNPELETEAGEYYIDTLSVSEGHQGKGIGKQLIHALIGKAKSLKADKIGLLVDQSNPKAEKLYTSMGFKIVNEKDLLGGKYNHMQYT
ncbi:GNAT family N-acetyltransferase [Pedobacter metabolipauper]|uniref:Acetyltransferase (GNAT) family protein n=1 Tax=Pedobacter metabolipauper TaxID=425513 RepID=A0A4R6SZC5_9SPHI|nr:GNAT family N-acetyltransferase [Pedobacter metabolipauper]TDQ11385.1 acetyltransferase (GNAT) family protein [Pedobacter metabolipauper]